MSDEVLIEKRDDGVAVLTLNRPHALNAIDRNMVRLLREAIFDIEADERIDIVLVRGSGDKAFCVGVDLKERQVMSDDDARAYRADELFPMYAELEARSKPAIALVDGHCLAGGFEVALSCDMIIATPHSSFGLPEVRWGLVPAAGGCRKLPGLIGAARAKELILTATTIEASHAARIGLVNRLVAREELLASGLDLARRMRSNVQIAVRGAKRCIDHAIEHSSEFDIEVSDLCYAANERKEGISRFIERKNGRA